MFNEISNLDDRKYSNFKVGSTNMFKGLKEDMNECWNEDHEMKLANTEKILNKIEFKIWEKNLIKR